MPALLLATALFNLNRVPRVSQGREDERPWEQGCLIPTPTRRHIFVCKPLDTPVNTTVMHYTLAEPRNMHALLFVTITDNRSNTS